MESKMFFFVVAQLFLVTFEACFTATKDGTRAGMLRERTQGLQRICFLLEVLGHYFSIGLVYEFHLFSSKGLS